ncbi:MAG: hypothetical protein ACKO11_10765 [Cuspidothrix sp.]
MVGSDRAIKQYDEKNQLVLAVWWGQRSNLYQRSQNQIQPYHRLLERRSCHFSLLLISKVRIHGGGNWGKRSPFQWHLVVV